MEWQPGTEKAMSSSSKHCAAESFRVFVLLNQNSRIQASTNPHMEMDNAASGDILVPPAWGTKHSPPRTKDLATETSFQFRQGELGPQENIQEEKKVNRAQEQKQLERCAGPHVPHPPIPDTQNLPHLEIFIGRPPKLPNPAAEYTHPR